MNQTTKRWNSLAKERQGQGLDTNPFSLYMTQRECRNGQSESKQGIGSGAEDSDFTIEVTRDDIDLYRTLEVLPV